MTERMQLLDLPDDILYMIIPYLDATSFVAFTSTCKAYHHPDLAQYAPYWSSVTRNTFRVPNQPVVENDGRRWQKMYRRLLTESRCFTWGNNDKACLGHGQQALQGQVHVGPAMRRRPFQIAHRHVSWPTEMNNTEHLGVIADIQCGGWTTNFLTSKGGLYSVGAMNGMVYQAAHTTPEKLRYPAGLPHPNERYEPATAIKQFSAGRCHILALSDSGYLWSWDNIDHAALQVKFLNYDIVMHEKDTSSTRGYVKKAVAGWSKSAALVVGSGIVVWEPLRQSPNQQAREEDTILVTEMAAVPGTDFQRQPINSFEASDFSKEIGEVQNFICLEQYIVFNTHHGKVYAARIAWDNLRKDVSDVREIPLHTSSTPVSSEKYFATDVQGTFRSFAIFTNTGDVFTGRDELLESLFTPQNTMRPLSRIPALQNSEVISIAFGDYHFHALHAPGYITSYGTESQGCGCLGLGGHGNPEGRIRGIRYQGIGGDGRLVAHADVRGRRVWFEKEKQKWITFLTSGGKDPEEAVERMRMLSDPKVQGEVSEWVEQEGQAWEEKFGGANVARDDDGLASYFALSVTAAGWHSGALVLVNEEKASKIREACTEAPDEIAEGNKEAEDDQNDDPGFIDRALGYASEFMRWFNGSPLPGTRPGGPNFRDPNDPEAFSHPQNHGAVDEKGRPYVWSRDSFPRLRLANGQEMPGTAEISEWRYGQPDWQGNVPGY